MGKTKTCILRNVAIVLSLAGHGSCVQLDFQSSLEPAASGHCFDWPQATFSWELCDAGQFRKPTANLGGLGPDLSEKREIRYPSVGKFNNVMMDLVVTNKSIYVPYNLSRNVAMDMRNAVAYHGCFGVVNLAHDSNVTLNFAFVKHQTHQPMVFDASVKFVFGIWDIDNSLADDNQEVVTLSPLFLTGDPRTHTDIGMEFSTGMDLVSKVFGKGADNPNNTDAGTSKSIEAQYHTTSNWDVDFAVRGGSRGRNFLFAGCRKPASGSKQ